MVSAKPTFDSLSPLQETCDLPLDEQKARLVEFYRDPNASTRLWSLWRAGHAATGNHATASHLADVEATTFMEACVLYWAQLSASDRYFWALNTNGSGDLADHYWAIWGCRVYNNEAAARKSFG